MQRGLCFLGFILESFPLVQSPVHQSAAIIHDSSAAPCVCPIHQFPHRYCITIPEFYKKLWEGYYCLITFGTCEHQQLPLIGCPPLKFMAAPDAKPVAHLTPVHLPLHWRDAVKEDLDQDVRLTIIETSR